MSDYGIVTEAGTVRFERLLPGPIERVWAYLTTSDKRGLWLATGDMALAPGGRVDLTFRHADLSPIKEPTPERYRGKEGGARLAGTVVRCDPPKLLVHTWGEGADASEVTFELTPRGDEVLMVLTHRRLSAGAMTGVASGWHTHLAILADQLAGRTPRPFWSTHAALAADYAVRLAAAPAERRAG